MKFPNQFTGLFHRAIAQSGATTAPWAVQHHVKEWTMILAQDVGCPIYNTTSRDVLACLRKVEAKPLVEFRKKITLPYVYLHSYIFSAPMKLTEFIDIR